MTEVTIGQTETGDDDIQATHGGFVDSVWPACKSYPLTAVLTALCLLVLGLYLLAHFPKSYVAVAIITPPAELDRLNPAASATGGGLAALSSLTGGPQTAGQTRYEAFVTLLTSRRIAEAMIAKHDILPRLYHSAYDPVTAGWKKPKGVVFSLHEKFLAAMGYPGWSPPGADTLAEYLKGHLTVAQSTRSSQRTLTMRSRTPDLAVDLLRWAVAESDAAVRSDERSRAQAQLDFIRQSMEANITVIEDRTVLSELLLSTQRSILMASTGATFSEDIIQAPESSDKPNSPPLGAGIGLIVLVSLAGGIGAAILRYRGRQLRRP